MRECWLGTNRNNFKLIVVASANILPLLYAEVEELDSCLQTLVMWNGTEVVPVGFDPWLFGFNDTENESANRTQGKLQ